jgi:ribosomal protein L11 methyltransferase
VINPPLWKAYTVVKKSEAADAASLFELAPPGPQAVLINEEPFADKAVVEALYTEMPDGDYLTKLAGREVIVELLPDIDWIKLSQEGLPPVRAGRFFVYGAHDKGKVPPAVVPIRIEAGMAFGTGHHETTALCLTAMSDLSKARRFENVLDLGTGTGLLAIGAAKLWKKRVIASDIDQVAVEIAKENARANGEGPLVNAFTADGLVHPALAAAAPYDLLIANILAAPLTFLAPQIARSVTRGSMIILSGLLVWQENLVLSFYRPHDMVLRRTYRRGPWSALVLEARGGRR